MMVNCRCYQDAPSSAAMPLKLISQGWPPMLAAFSTSDLWPRCMASNFPSATIQSSVRADTCCNSVAFAPSRIPSGRFQECKLLSSTRHAPKDTYPACFTTPQLRLIGRALASACCQSQSSSSTCVNSSAVLTALLYNNRMCRSYKPRTEVSCVHTRIPRFLIPVYEEIGTGLFCLQDKLHAHDNSVT